jgi:hypothetical protein
MQSNSPRVRVPVDYGRVMGERPITYLALDGTHVRTNEVLGAFPSRSAPVLPVRLRSREQAGRDYRRPHYHLAACGHAIACVPVAGTCERLATRTRPACAAASCK